MKLILALAVLALLDSCAGTETPVIAEDGGVRNADGGLDAGASNDASPIADPDAAPPGADSGPSGNVNEYDDNDSFSGRVAACYDNLDNNNDGAADCDDTSCQANVGSCCVGSNTIACCGVPSAVTLEFGECDGPLDTCLAREEIVALGDNPAVARDLDGATRIFLEQRASDAGLTLDRALDPRAGVVRVEATIAAPMSSEPEIDAMGVALIDPALDPADVARVAPIAGFLVSRNRHQVSFLLAGEVVQSWAITDGDDHIYALAIEPDGAVTLHRDLVELQRAELEWRAPVRAVLYGRGGAGTGAVSAGRVALGVSACDMPDAVVRDAGLAIPSRPAWAMGDSLREPSVAQSGSRVRMALRVGPDIHLAEPDGLGGFAIRGDGTPLLGETTQPWGTGGVADPALRSVTGGLELYFTAFDDSGAASIGRVLETAPDTFDIPNAEQLLDPNAFEEIDGFSSPAPFVHQSQLHLAVVEERADGGRPIAIWNIDADPPIRVSEVRRPDFDELFAFDREEVAAPSVVTLDEVVRLYFAGRRGNRWTVGVVVSDELMEWRSPEVDQVLTSTETGFDALGARDPAVFLEGQTLRLYYAGTDGSRTDLGSASAALP